MGVPGTQAYVSANTEPGVMWSAASAAAFVAALDIHAAREQNAQRMRGIADTVNRLKFVKFTRTGVQTAQKRG